MSYGLSETVLNSITSTIRKNSNVEDIILFGSRAKGNYRKYSDIDLTLTGDNLVHTDLFKIYNDLDDLNLPYEIGLSLLSEITYPPLLKEITDFGIRI